MHSELVLLLLLAMAALPTVAPVVPALATTITVNGTGDANKLGYVVRMDARLDLQRPARG